MISNQANITNVYRGKGQDEYYFLYKGKYRWSISSDQTGEYYLLYYDTDFNIKKLSELPNEEEYWTNIHMMGFNTKELKSKEALESFQELYQVVKGKVLGIDKVLNDIIKDL